MPAVHVLDYHWIFIFLFSCLILLTTSWESNKTSWESMPKRVGPQSAIQHWGMATMAVVHRHGQTLPDLSWWPVGPWRFACMWSLCCVSNVNDVLYNNVLERVSWDWRWIMSFFIANSIERESLGLFQWMTKLQNQPLGCLQQWAHTEVEWNQMGQVAQIQINRNSSVQQAPCPYHGTIIS
jgi:hypothetical protein